jgi:hypothetical protein
MPVLVLNIILLYSPPYILSILRKKFISHLFHICNSVDKLEKTIDEYVVFFNTQRPHASLKYNTLEK